MKDYIISLSLTVDGSTALYTFTNSGENDVFELKAESSKERIKVTLLPKRCFTVEKAELSFAWSCGRKDRILLNGYQSWTDTRELTAKDRMYGLRRTPKFAIKRFGLASYGDYSIVDYSGKKGALHGFSYGYIRSAGRLDFVGSLNERTGYTILKYSAAVQKLTLEKDCSGITVSEPYEIFDFAMLSGSDDKVFDRWFELMGIEKPTAKPLRGYTSWYNHYQGINSDIISKDLAGMKSLPVAPEIFQIDDGYQTSVGDWLSIDSAKFPDGLKPIVDRIHSDGMLAGLWLAPFVCETKSAIYSEHSDWLLRGEDGEPVFCGGNWSGFYALDLEKTEVREYLRKVFSTVLGEWGFDFVKLDFLYAASMIHRGDKTRGQTMCEAMDFLRELVGDKPILGCGVPLWPAFGKVEYCRIGCDVGLDWNDKPIMRLIHRERVSTRNAVCDSVFRRQLDGRAFMNDPDVFLLRRNNIKLSDKRKEQLATVNGLFGSVLFMSDDASEYSDAQKGFYLRTVSLGRADVTKITVRRRKLKIAYRFDGNKYKLKIRL